MWDFVALSLVSALDARLPADRAEALVGRRGPAVSCLPTPHAAEVTLPESPPDQSLQSQYWRWVQAQGHPSLPQPLWSSQRQHQDLRAQGRERQHQNFGSKYINSRSDPPLRLLQGDQDGLAAGLSAMVTSQRAQGHEAFSSLTGHL